MKIKLLDYRGLSEEFDIGDLDNVSAMRIDVISGDEVLTVFYKDNDRTSKVFDSSITRRFNAYDKTYEIYNCENDKNLIDNPDFLNRVSSHWNDDLE